MNVGQGSLPDADASRKLQLNPVLRRLIVQLPPQTLAQDAATRIKSSKVGVTFADQIDRVPCNDQMQGQYASQEQKQQGAIFLLLFRLSVFHARLDYRTMTAFDPYIVGNPADFDQHGRESAPSIATGHLTLRLIKS